MKQPRIVIAAPKSGSGKTLITIALLQALKARGKKVRAFKCGPDYIDPMFHKKALGIPSKNLDLFFLEEDMARASFMEENDSDISVIEGVMGLYDGMGAISQKASTYHLAKTLKAPIVLVVNASGMAGSLLAEIKGFLDFDEDKLIAGIILNQMSAMLYGTIKEAIETRFDVKVLGYFPKQPDLKIESRYLGLTLPEEIERLQDKIVLAGETIEKTVDLNGLLELAGNAAELEGQYRLLADGNPQEEKLRIAVALDEAFCFYYEDNLRMLEKLGCELVYFSPLHDRILPKDVKGIILGGGYPELFAKELSENVEMRRDIRKAIQKGIPSLAECGGFMYLHEAIETKEKQSFDMVGVVPGKCFYAGKLVRFGYYNFTYQGEEPFTIRGHEFHYFDSTNCGEDVEATKPIGNRHFKCCHVGENHFYGFAHLYYPSAPIFIEHFLKSCKEK